MSRWLLHCLFFSLLAVAAFGQPSTAPTGAALDEGKSAKDLFTVRESNGAAGKHKYSLFLPRKYKASTKYPMIVFLHGFGEQGDDGMGCRTVELGPYIVRKNGDFPFIAVFPQTGVDWTTDQSEKIMLDAIDDVVKNFSVDKDRTALTGINSGGTGTWVLGARHPEIFSCLAPMAAWKAEDQVPHLVKYPIWAVHNDGDLVIPVANTKEMISKLQAAGAHPKLSIYDTGGHDCWDQAYDDGQLLKWLAEQRRGK